MGNKGWLLGICKVFSRSPEGQVKLGQVKLGQVKSGQVKLDSKYSDS